MKKTLREIKSSLPGIEVSEKVELLSDELDRILAIKRLFDSEGGAELIKLLRENCFVTLRKLIVTAKSEPDLGKLLSLIAVYSANVDLLASMQDISSEDEIRKQLDEAVKEIYKL